MFQAAELQRLLVLLKEISDDIIVYTGYKINEIKPDMLSNISRSALKTRHPASKKT